MGLGSFVYCCCCCTSFVAFKTLKPRNTSGCFWFLILALQSLWSQSSLTGEHRSYLTTTSGLHHRITQYPQLEGTPKHHEVRLLAPHRTTQIPGHMSESTVQTRIVVNWTGTALYHYPVSMDSVTLLACAIIPQQYPGVLWKVARVWDCSLGAAILVWMVNLAVWVQVVQCQVVSVPDKLSVGHTV